MCQWVDSRLTSPADDSPEGLDWGAKSGMFWAGIVAILLTWTFFRLPECRGRTYGELDILFEQKVPARQFARTAVDQYEVDKRENANKNRNDAGDSDSVKDGKKPKGHSVELSHKEDVEQASGSSIPVPSPPKDGSL